MLTIFFLFTVTGSEKAQIGLRRRGKGTEKFRTFVEENVKGITGLHTQCPQC